jgi:hypothetical protein
MFRCLNTIDSTSEALSILAARYKIPTKVNFWIEGSFKKIPSRLTARSYTTDNTDNAGKADLNHLFDPTRSVVKKLGYE